MILHHIEAANAEAKAAQICGKIADLQIMALTGAVTVSCSAGVSLIQAIAGDDVVVQADQAMSSASSSARQAPCRALT